MHQAIAKAAFLHPPSLIVPSGWPGKALVKPFQPLIPGQHQSLGTDPEAECCPSPTASPPTHKPFCRHKLGKL